MELLMAWVVVIAMAAGAPPHRNAERTTDVEKPSSTVRLNLEISSCDLLATAMAETREEVRAVVYKFDDSELLPDLMEALERGLTLQVLCDAKEAGKTDSRIPELAAAGAQVRTWPRQRGKLHAKFVVFDYDRVLTGSWNWTRSARQGNLELIMDIGDPTTVARFRKLFAQLWETAQPLASN